MSGSYDSTLNDNDVVKMVEADSLSDSESSQPRLGRKTIPETHSYSSLIYYIGIYRGDVPFVMALIRISMVELTKEQNKLLEDVNEGARFNQLSGNMDPFDEALDAFLDSLERSFDAEYFGKRKDMYVEVFQVLDHSFFPYSPKQNNCLDEIKNALYEATGDPYFEADRVINDKFVEFVKLLEGDDHYKSLVPYRAVIWSMIPYHLKKMTDKLRGLAKKEEEWEVPNLLYGSETLSLAGYLLGKMEPLIDKLRLHGGLEHFHDGMIEIYDMLIRIFRLATPYLFQNQEKALKEFESEFSILRREPRGSKYDKIAPIWYKFLEEFGGTCLNQEVKIDVNGESKPDPDGPCNKLIMEMGTRLKHLKFTASRHLVEFPFIGMGIKNIVAETTDRFLSIYQLD